MSTTPVAPSKYLVKSIEEEISLFDRKLAHLHNFETFPSEEERTAAAGRLSAKRERLVRTLRELTDPAPAPTATRKSVKKPAEAKTSAQPKNSQPAKAAITALPTVEAEQNPAE